MYKKLLENHQYEEALMYLDSHEFSFIDLSYVYDQKGRIHHILGHLDLAIEYLKKAYALDQDLVTLEELGNCYLDSGNYDEAIACFKETNQYNLAYCLMEVERFREAIEVLLTLENDHWVNMNLMICYEMIGEDSKARSYALLEYKEDRDILKELILINYRLDDLSHQKEYIDLLDDPLTTALYYNHIHEYSKAIEYFSILEETEEMLRAYIYACVEENLREKAYELSKRLYHLTNALDDLIELLEIGVIASRKDLIEYIHIYPKVDEFITKKKIRYDYEFNYQEGIILLENYPFEVDEEYMQLKLIYLEKEGKSIDECQQWILKHRQVTIDYPSLKTIGIKINYPEIERIFQFCDGLAYIENKEAGGFIDESGQLVIDFQLPKDTTKRMDCYMFNKGKAIIYNGKYSLIDTSGNYLLENCDEIAFSKYGIFYVKDHQSYLGDYHYDKICHKEKEGRLVYDDQSYIDIEGNQISKDYDQAYNFHEGYGRVIQNGLTGYVDLNGQLVIECKYLNGHDIYGNQFAYQKEYYGVIDLQGNMIVDFIYDEIKEDEKFYYVRKKNKWGVLLHNGELLVDLIYDEILYYWNGIARVKLNNYYGAINEEGRVAIDIAYDHMTYAHHGITIVGLSGRFGYMTTSNRLLTPISYTNATLKGSHNTFCVGINHMFYIIRGDELWNS